MDLKISDMLNMQKELQLVHPEWGGTPPERAQDQLLWAIGEMGEVIDIFKKRGVQRIMEEPLTRTHLVEELTDVQMYLMDIMLCLGITPEEYSRAHFEKHERNMKRNYRRENEHMFDSHSEE